MLATGQPSGEANLPGKTCPAHSEARKADTIYPEHHAGYLKNA